MTTTAAPSPLTTSRPRKVRVTVDIEGVGHLLVLEFPAAEVMSQVVPIYDERRPLPLLIGCDYHLRVKAAAVAASSYTVARLPRPRPPEPRHAVPVPGEDPQWYLPPGSSSRVAHRLHPVGEPAYFRPASLSRLSLCGLKIVAAPFHPLEADEAPRKCQKCVVR